ncbi:MAG: hypothetical protein ACOCYT_01780 [Chloroflexota bacterium]
MNAAEVFEVKSYMVIFRQEEIREFDGTSVTIRTMVRCTGDEYTMDVIFYAPGSPYPAPVIDLDNKKGYMFMPMSDLPAFVDILRNEKPVYAHLRSDRREWTSITTTQEPVGEGEGKA